MTIRGVLGARGQVSGPLATGAGGAALPWWNPDGATPGGGGGTCVGAYRAIDTPGSLWGAGPANYAESLINLANPGTYDLTEGNGAVPWAALTGWGFVTALAKYLIPGIIPNADMSLMSQHSDLVASVVAPTIAAFQNTPARLYLYPEIGTNAVGYGKGGISTVAPRLISGNLCVSGQVGYRNGIPDGAPILSGFIPTNTPYIGATNSQTGLASQFITANIRAIALYTVELTAAQVLARATAMSLL